MYRYLLLTLALLAPLAAAAPATDAWAWVDEAAQRRLGDRLEARAQSAVAPWQVNLPTATARWSRQPLFSSQAGSWPFEPFAHNGLFAAIAGYQPQHPQALVLSEGRISLAALHRALNDPAVLDRHKDGYLLSYPLLIEPGAALTLDDTHLYLNAASGTALINRGTLRVRGTTIESWSPGGGRSSARPWRPFIVSWAGSTLDIERSTLRRLGYNAHLARGLTAARSAAQGNAAPARVRLADSHVEALSALELSQAQVVLRNTRIEQMEQFGLDLNDSLFLVEANRIEHVRNESAIRLRGQSRGLLRDNLILAGHKAGIEIRQQQGSLALIGNRIGATAGSGLLLRDLGQADDGGLLVRGNLIGNSGAQGVDGERVGRLLLLDNRIDGNRGHAVSLTSAEGSAGRLVMIGNRIERTGRAPLHSERLAQLVLGPNVFRLAVQQNALEGELLPLQPQLLDATRRAGCTLALRPRPAAGQPLPAHPTCAEALPPAGGLHGGR